MKINFVRYATDGSGRRMWDSGLGYPRVRVCEWKKGKKFGVSLWADGDTEVSSMNFDTDLDALAYAESL